MKVLRARAMSEAINAVWKMCKKVEPNANLDYFKEAEAFLLIVQRNREKSKEKKRHTTRYSWYINFDGFIKELH